MGKFEKFFQRSRIDTAKNDTYLCGSCGSYHLLNADYDITLSAEDDAYYKKMIDDLFEGQADTDVLTKKSVKITAKKLAKALEEGMGKKLSEVDYNTPDDGVYKAMEKNVYEFSQAKNHTQMKALNEALYDGKRLRTYEEFKREAFVILDGNLTHLKAEYNHAVAAAQAARKWAEFPEGAMLKYITVGDERVRASHELLDGIVARKESDFWKTYFIPLDWGCRCNVIEVTDEKETDLSTRELPDITSIFRPNVGVFGQVYSKKSNVFKGIPPRELEKAVYAMPENHQWEVLHNGIKGGFVKVHHVAKDQEEEDYKDLVAVGKQLSTKGYKVEILPKIYDPLQRGITLPGVKDMTHWQLRVDDEYMNLDDAEEIND